MNCKNAKNLHNFLIFLESYFLIQWEKHVDDDDHHILKFRAKIFPDGTIRFIYHNFLKVALDAVKKTGYPAIIGVQVRAVFEF